MVLTSSHRRRTAGFTALFAALLLILTAVMIASPAGATERTCQDLAGYDTNYTDDTSGPWGSIEFESDNGPLVLTVNDGYAVALCLKKGSAASGGGPIESPDNPYIGPIVDLNVVYPNADDMSHYSYRLIDVATPEAPTFVDPSCEEPNAAAVNLPETDGVDYSYDNADVVPGGTVTVTATPKAGYVFKNDAKTTWEYTFPTLPENCEEPTEVTPDAPSFTDPTCDVQTVGLDLPADTDAVTYTVSGDQEPGGTVTVTATVADGYVLAEGAKTEWVNTYGDVPTNCGGVDEDVVDPAASVSVTCDAATIHLDNRASTGDKDVTYTITGVAGHDTVVVPAGTDQTIDIESTLSEDVAYDITVSAEGMDDATAAGTFDCVTPSTPTTTPPTTDVSPDEVEKEPAPDPAPTAQPAAQAAAQDELPATGLGSTELLLLALLMLGLGTAALLASDPRRQN